MKIKYLAIFKGVGDLKGYTKKFYKDDSGKIIRETRGKNICAASKVRHVPSMIKGFTEVGLKK